MKPKCILALLMATLLLMAPIAAQAASGARDLKAAIARMDAALFDAFNACDVAAFTALLQPDVEFYHDQGGRMLSARTQAQGMASRCAEHGRNGVLRRELVRASLEVYPIHDYGAVEIGMHKFYRTLPGQPERLSSVARFMHVWEHGKDGWRLARIVSYAHEDAGD